MAVNLIQKALDEVRFCIPEAILDLVFVSRDYRQRRLPVSVDAKIRELVIQQRVMVDCRLVGGTQVEIPLEGLVPEFYGNFEAIYRIPKNRTQNRVISNVYSIAYSNLTGGSTMQVGDSNASALLGAAAQVFAAVTPANIISTAYLELIGENTVLVRDNTILPTNLTLRCMLEYDEQFSSIKPTSYHDWCKLVELATKAYIFNNYAIKMDEGVLQGGVQLGRIREIIDGYSDSNELYYTHLRDTWRKVSLLNDTESKQRHLRALIARR